MTRSGVGFDAVFEARRDNILKGAKPADLLVQQAMKFEFVINLKAAKQISLTLPYELLALANRVIK